MGLKSYWFRFKVRRCRIAPASFEGTQLNLAESPVIGLYLSERSERGTGTT
jgi:hypothetical protein